MKKILILLGLLVWVGTVYGQSGVIRRTQTALVDTLPTHIVKANWDTYISSIGGIPTPTRQALTSSTTITFDGDNGTWASLTLAHNATLTFNDFDDFTEGKIRVVQDGTGSRTLAFAETITAVTAIEYDGGFELIQPTASTTTWIEFVIDGATLRISISWQE